jgi:hypothetical protein
MEQKMKKYVQPERKMYLSDDREVIVRYDYSPAERQWFDARAGVGSPGCDAELCITEINLGNGFISIDQSGLDDAEIEIERLEDRLMVDISEEESESNAAFEEAEYNAWKDSRSLEEV